MGTKYPRRDEERAKRERFVTSRSPLLDWVFHSLPILILALVALMANLCAKRSSITGARE